MRADCFAIWQVLVSVIPPYVALALLNTAYPGLPSAAALARTLDASSYVCPIPVTKLAFPNAQNLPSFASKLAPDFSVADHGPLELMKPELESAPSGFGNIHLAAAFVSMPKATVGEYSNSLGPKCKIGLAENALIMSAPVGNCMPSKKRDHAQLRGPIPARSDSGHHIGPLFRCKDIRHHVVCLRRTNSIKSATDKSVLFWLVV